MAESPVPVSRPPTNRRGQCRLPVRGVAFVRTPQVELVANTVDISAHGVCLTLPSALEVGSTYRIDLSIESPTSRAKSVVARVCFCLKEKNGYRIGFHCSLEEFVHEADNSG